MDKRIHPFRISVDENVLDDLKSRLRNTRWPEAELVDDWSQGVPLSWIKEVCRYWAEHYDWRHARGAAQSLSRSSPPRSTGSAFTSCTSARRIPEAMPLIITHGWPGSVVEFHKVIEPLTDPTAHGGNAADAFHVVCPSLPGFGFSDKPATTGWGVDRIASAWAELMDRLGYARYGAQGGDWGSAVTTALGAQDPDHCAGIHITLAMGARPNVEGQPTPEEARALQGHQILRRLGFRLFQAAIDPAADARLRPDGFAERAGGLDPGKILGLDRLRRAPRKHPRPRRAARQRHAVLGDGDGGLVGAALLGKLRAGAPHHPQGRRADRRGRLSPGDRDAGAALDGSATSPTSGIGAKCRRAATSPPSSSPSCSCARCGTSSGICVPSDNAPDCVVPVRASRISFAPR